MKTVTQGSFVRGVNAVTGKATIVQGSVKRISNMLYTRRGSVLTCDGTKLLTAGTPTRTWDNNVHTGATAGPIAMIAATSGAAPPFPMALVLGSIGPSAGKLTVVDLGTNPATTPTIVPPGGGTGTIFLGGDGTYPLANIADRLPQLLNVAGLVVFCNGSDVPPVWVNFFNFTSGLVGAASDYQVAGGAHGVFHQGALWLWNTAAIDGVVDGPSTLRMCAIDASGNPDVTNFPRLNQYFVDRNDGTQGQGCISFTSAEAGIAPTATLVLFKDFATYQVTGLLTPGGGVSITRAQTEMGCFAPRSIQFAPGFGIVRMTHYGLAVFDGANDKLISEEIRPYLFQTEPDIQSMDWSRVSQCYAALTVNPPMYVIGIPLPNVGGLSRLLCFDLVIKQWTVIDFPSPSDTVPGPMKLLTTMKLGSKRPLTYVSDWQPLWSQYNTQPCPGKVRKWQDGDQSWDGTAVNWMVKPPPIFADNPTTPFYVRRANLRARTVSAPVTAAFSLDNVQNTNLSVSNTFNYLQGQGLYGTGRYGGSTYDAASPDLVIPFDVGAKCWSSSVQYTGSGPIELMATDWQVQPKPPVAQPRVS